MTMLGRSPTGAVPGALGAAVSARAAAPVSLSLDLGLPPGGPVVPSSAIGQAASRPVGSPGKVFAGAEHASAGPGAALMPGTGAGTGTVNAAHQRDPAPAAATPRMITYEYPLNERVRTLLRLEDMYERVLLFMRRETARDHEVAFSRLFEILDAGSRADMKSDLLQELERQRVLLESLRGNPGVSGDRLDEAVAEVSGAASALHATQGKFGQHLRDNEWLMAIRSRFNIPGGACEFDLPGYHHWLHQPSYVRQGQLQAWLEPLQPLHRALRTVLRFLRESGEDTQQLARRGTFQQMPILRPAQMLRLQLPDGLDCVPEISANKYALNIRFISNSPGLRPCLHAQDVPFLIAYCNL